jgi:hypothetical protein
MLDYFSITIEAKKVHGYILFVSRPGLVCMQSNQFALGNGPHEFYFFTRVISGHFIKVFDKCLLAITY